MARSEARFQFGIWREGLDGQGPYAKLLYAVLLTEPTVNFAGVGAIRMGKWARNASLTVPETAQALKELVAGGYVLVDEETDEVLVRTMIRNDGVADQPYVLKGAIKEALQTESRPLRRALAQELRKLPPKKPDGRSKVGKPVYYPDPHAAADELEAKGSEPPPKGFSDSAETLFAEHEKKGFERVPRGAPPSPSPSPSPSFEKTAAANQDRFAEFYAVYPKRVKRLAAEKAWRAALRRGVSPDLMIAKASAFAETAVGKDMTYVPHPATWINSGAYEDDVELRLVAGGNPGGYQPYRNPVDDSVWDEPLLPPREAP